MNNNNNGKKRPRATETGETKSNLEIEAGVDAAAATSKESEKNPQAAPPYASLEYWNSRYRHHHLQESCQDAKIGEKKRKKVNENDKNVNQDDVGVPFHAWYFSYQELRPILLPLILGSSDDFNNQDNDKSENKNGSLQADVPKTDAGHDLDEGAKNGTNSNVMENSTETASSHRRRRGQLVMDATVEKKSNAATSNKHVDEQQESRSSRDGDENDDESSSPSSIPTDDEDEEIHTEEEMDNDDDSNSSTSTNDLNEYRPGLARNGPIHVLEIGCGDVPLGTDLVLDFIQLGKHIDEKQQNQNHQESVNNSDDNDQTKDKIDDTADPQSTAMTPKLEDVLDRVTCTDYCSTIIDVLKQRHQDGLLQYNNRTQQTTTTLSSNDLALLDIILDYQVMDARNMEQGRLSSANNDTQEQQKQKQKKRPQEHGVDLILEKGTLDAMLSDKVRGIPDCIQIMAECARVLKVGGTMMLISHLNAYTDRGMEWLQTVVMGGLEQEATRQQQQQQEQQEDNGKDPMGMDTQDCSNYSWLIEVHGNDGLDDIAEHIETKTTADDDKALASGASNVDNVSRPPPSGSPGPCVYLIHKLPRDENSNEGKHIDKNGLTGENSKNKNGISISVRLKFYTY